MSLSGLAARVVDGDVRAASRLIRQVEDGVPAAIPQLIALYPHAGRAAVIGLTGAPGSGKSTISNRLITFYREAGKRVGVIAVDPTSPFSGGAILGDRVRMQGHATDEGVFIRSLATRGQLGGLARAATGGVRVMDALGCDVIIVETVGVGQAEVDVAQLAHTTIVVVVPGLGDDIQAIKAGILEVADIFVVNKADLDGADRVVRELRAMLDLKFGFAPLEHDSGHRMHSVGAAPKAAADRAWDPPIQKVIAARGTGIDALVAAIESHRIHRIAAGPEQAAAVRKAKAQLLATLQERFLTLGLEVMREGGKDVDAMAARVAARTVDPIAEVEDVAQWLSSRQP